LLRRAQLLPPCRRASRRLRPAALAVVRRAPGPIRLRVRDHLRRPARPSGRRGLRDAAARVERAHVRDLRGPARDRGPAAAAVAVLLSTLGVTSTFAQAATRAYVLDTAAHALVALELPSGRRVGSLALPGSPWAMTQSPDGARLVVFDRGPGEDKKDRGYK